MIKLKSTGKKKENESLLKLITRFKNFPKATKNNPNKVKT